MKFKILLYFCMMIVCCSKSFTQNYRIDPDSMIKNIIYNDNQYVIGKELCDFETVSLNGEAISNDQLIGRVTLVNLWFEACAPCIAELADLSNLYNKYKNNRTFQFLSFTVDNVSVARNAVSKYHIPFTVCPISRELAYKFNFNFGFPTNMIINKEGKIVFFNIEAIYSKKNNDKNLITLMDELIDKILGEE